MARKSAGLPAKAWGEMTKGEKLSAATELALDAVRQILELGIDPDDVKLLAQVKDTALQIISQQIRVQENELRALPRDEPLLEYRAALAKFEDEQVRARSKSKRGEVEE